MESIKMLNGIATNGCNMIGMMKMIKAKVCLLNAIMYNDARNDNKGVTHIDMDFHIFAVNKSGILWSVIKACL